jgi:hypothetical protein
MGHMCAHAKTLTKIFLDLYLKKMAHLCHWSKDDDSQKDFLELQVRRLESQGLSAKQAEAITAVITEVLNDSLENVAQSFTSKTEMQRVCMLQTFDVLAVINISRRSSVCMI